MIGVWYFSATGNGKRLAQIINSEFSEAETDLVDITPYNVRFEMKKSICYDKLIVIFPIYAGDVPNPLKEFFRQLQGNNVKTILIALWGNVHTSNALYNAKEILKRQGFCVVSGAEIVSEHSYNTDSIKLGCGRPTAEEISKLKYFLYKSLAMASDSVIFPKVRRTFLMLLPQSFIPRKVIRLSLDPEKCTNCNICKNKCPVNAINDNVSIDDKKCIRCLSCVTSCPLKARNWSFATPLAQKVLSKSQSVYNNCNFYD